MNRFGRTTFDELCIKRYNKIIDIMHNDVVLIPVLQYLVHNHGMLHGVLHTAPQSLQNRYARLFNRVFYVLNHDRIVERLIELRLPFALAHMQYALNQTVNPTLFIYYLFQQFY
jgi:hypothetical protein